MPQCNWVGLQSTELLLLGLDKVEPFLSENYQVIGEVTID